jgi:hypothetical protein
MIGFVFAGAISAPKIYSFRGHSQVEANLYDFQTRSTTPRRKINKLAVVLGGETAKKFPKLTISWSSTWIWRAPEVTQLDTSLEIRDRGS